MAWHLCSMGGKLVASGALPHIFLSETTIHGLGPLKLFRTDEKLLKRLFSKNFKEINFSLDIDTSNRTNIKLLALLIINFIKFINFKLFL